MKQFYLLDLERSILTGAMYFWKGDKRGYTTEILKAGIYPEEIAKEIVMRDLDKRTVMFSAEVVVKLLERV
jgi:hypothetical protein